MPARVFISCGQATKEERWVATDLEKWFRSGGYDPYVAVQVQTIGGSERWNNRSVKSFRLLKWIE